jgi:hypothetical protein
MKLRLFIVILLAWSILAVHSSVSASSEKDLPAAFYPIKWNMSEEDIRTAFSGQHVETTTSESGMNAVTGSGEAIYGKLHSITVYDYDWKGFFPVNMYFNTIKKYKFIQIESKRKWDNCDDPHVNKTTCAREREKLVALYEKTINNLNKKMGKKGKFAHYDEMNRGEKMYTWNMDGFEISFSLIIDEAISYVDFFIREKEEGHHAKTGQVQSRY